MNTTGADQVITELRDMITEHLLKSIGDDLRYAGLCDRILDSATIGQLWAIYRRYVLTQSEFRLVTGTTPMNPYIGISYAGMFVGIEEDGYAHT